MLIVDRVEITILFPEELNKVIHNQSIAKFYII